MSGKAAVEKGSLRALLRALLAWAVAAVVLCFVSALLIRAFAIPSAQYGYLSSALSFLCALIAGAVGARGSTPGSVLLGAGALALALLTLGCIVGGRLPEPSAVLSVGCFSFVGFLLGGLLGSRKKAETKRSSFHAKKKQNRKS